MDSPHGVALQQHEDHGGDFLVGGITAYHAEKRFARGTVSGHGEWYHSTFVHKDFFTTGAVGTSLGTSG